MIRPMIVTGNDEMISDIIPDTDALIPYFFKEHMMWLDAADLNTFMFHTGATVQYWKEKRSGKLARQLTSSKAPERQLVEGKMAVDFASAANDNMFLNEKAVPRDAWDGGGYFAFVFTVTDSTVNQGRILQIGNNRTIMKWHQVDAAGARFDFQHSFSGDNRFEFSGSDDVSVDEIHLIEVEYDADDGANRPTVRLDNAALTMNIGAAGTGTRQPEGDEGKLIGGLGSSNFSTDGGIHEMFLFDGILSDADQAILRAYLANKWGLTLS